MMKSASARRDVVSRANNSPVNASRSSIASVILPPYCPSRQTLMSAEITRTCLPFQVRERYWIYRLCCTRAT